MDTEIVRRFGVYELNLDTGELRRDGVPVPLQRQPARVLCVLASRPGELVPREELQSSVWGDSTHVDFNRGLNYCIRHLRETLKDEAKAPRFIETVARQGYRFVAPLAPPETAVVKSRRWLRVTAAAAAVVLLTIAVERVAIGRNQQHHELAVAVLRGLHDIVF